MKRKWTNISTTFKRKLNLKKSKGRHIERSEYEPFINDNIERYKVSKEIYRQRQAIVEHPFGTIKRQWGFDYTLLKSKEKVDAEFALIFTAYNLRRAISILGVKELILAFQALFLQIFAILRLLKVSQQQTKLFVPIATTEHLSC